MGQRPSCSLYQTGTKYPSGQFAQFEREVTGERIRDKFAASKKRGMWMGGNIPLGYDLKDRKLVINEKEAETVRTIFRLYTELGAVLKVKAEIDRLGLRTKLHTSESGAARGGLPFRQGHIYTILSSRFYRGEINHKGDIYPGEHEAIVDPILWECVHRQLASNVAVRRSGKSWREPSLLAGLLFDSDGNRMTPSHAVKSGKRYRYYISNNLIAGASSGRESKRGNGVRIPAQEIETHVVTAITKFLTDAQRVVEGLCPDDVSPTVARAAIQAAASFGAELEVGGQDRFEAIRSLVARVQVSDAAIALTLRLRPLIDRLGIPFNPVSLGADATLEMTIPAELRRLGKEMRLIVAAHTPKAHPDAVLIKAIVRAHLWFEMLKSQSVESITDIAKAERLPRTYVSSVIPFALLAPDITEAILEGTQPVDLSLDRLITAKLPLDWAEQRSVLGFK